MMILILGSGVEWWGGQPCDVYVCTVQILRSLCSDFFVDYMCLSVYAFNIYIYIIYIYIGIGQYSAVCCALPVDAEARASTVFALPFLAAVATNLRSPANFAPRPHLAGLLTLRASQYALPASSQNVLPVSTYLNGGWLVGWLRHVGRSFVVFINSGIDRDCSRIRQMSCQMFVS